MNNSLFHWGIPGMKWGVRRANRRAAAQARQSEDHKTVSSLRKKKISEMSNDELKKLTTRLQLEKQYKDLTKVDTGPAQKMITEVLLSVGKQTVTTYLAKYLPKALEKSFDSIMGIKKTPFTQEGKDPVLNPEQLAEVIKKMNGG